MFGQVMSSSLQSRLAMPNVSAVFKKLPLLGEFILVLLLAWIVAGWLLPSDSIQPTDSPYQSEQGVAAVPELRELAAVALFGKMKSEAVAPVAAKPAPVVRQPLRLKLLGTVVAGEKSAAVIALSAGKEQRTFFLGDTIQPGVKLHQVEADAVVVDQGGQLQRIMIEQGNKLTASPMPVSVTTPRSPTQRQMNRADMQRQLQDFPALLSQARAVPHLINGKPAGFIISEIVPGSLYQKAGLQNGDVVRSINGESITDAGQAMAMYAKLKEMTAIDIEVMRNGQLQHVHYVIR